VEPKPTDEEKELADAPPADAVERLRGKAREERDKRK
jgi:hypothetical protein